MFDNFDNFDKDHQGSPTLAVFEKEKITTEAQSNQESSTKSLFERGRPSYRPIATKPSPAFKPKTSKAPEKKAILDKKRQLSDRRRTSSLKREREGHSSAFDSSKKKKKGTGKSLDQYDLVTTFSNIRKEKSQDFDPVKHVSDDESQQCIKDIIHEILSRI